MCQKLMSQNDYLYLLVYIVAIRIAIDNSSKQYYTNCTKIRDTSSVQNNTKTTKCTRGVGVGQAAA